MLNLQPHRFPEGPGTRAAWCLNFIGGRAMEVGGRGQDRLEGFKQKEGVQLELFEWE